MSQPPAPYTASTTGHLAATCEVAGVVPAGLASNSGTANPHRYRVAGIVPAAGSGTRLGAGRPKAFVEVAGHTMLERATRGLLASGVVDDIVLVVPADLVDEAAAIAAPLSSAEHQVVVTAGGSERTDSVRLGLAALGGADGYDVLLVHDAARCLTPPEPIRRVVERVRAGERAVVPVLPVVDTIKVVDNDGFVCSTPERSALRAVQTPQGFHPETLLAAYRSAGQDSATDDAGLVERLGVPIATVAGADLAMKITTPSDFRQAEGILAADAAVSADAAQVDASSTVDAAQPAEPSASAESARTSQPQADIYGPVREIFKEC